MQINPIITFSLDECQIDQLIQDKGLTKKELQESKRRGVNKGDKAIVLVIEATGTELPEDFVMLLFQMEDGVWIKDPLGFHPGTPYPVRTAIETAVGGYLAGLNSSEDM